MRLPAVLRGNIGTGYSQSLAEFFVRCPVMKTGGPFIVCHSIEAGDGFSGESRINFHISEHRKDLRFARLDRGYWQFSTKDGSPLYNGDGIIYTFCFLGSLSIQDNLIRLEKWVTRLAGLKIF